MSDVATLRGVLDIPVGFPVPTVPSSNVVTEAKIELGRYLFYDVRLSANQTQSCETCHLQHLAFTDGKTVSEGSTGQKHPRNSPTLTNAIYNATLTWANPILIHLEDQILLPIFGEEPIELGVTGRDQEVLKRFSDNADYMRRFTAAFPDSDQPVTWSNVVKALSSFVRTLISGDSPFDRFVYQRDRSALSESALRGLDLFFSERLECHHCHGGFNFTASTVHENSATEVSFFHNTGLYNLDDNGLYPVENQGLFEITNRPEDMGRFRAPTLRNIEMTAPYMHDGSVATLEEVIRIYEAGGREITEGEYIGDGRVNPLKSGFVTGFTLTDQQRVDLLAFLNSLTDQTFLTNPKLSNPFSSTATTASR